MSIYDEILDRIARGDKLRECVGEFALSNDGVTVGELKEFLANMSDDLEVICTYDADENLCLRLYNDNLVDD